MLKWLLLFLVIAIAGAVIFELRPPEPITFMQITSPAFSNNGKIPLQYTCDGASARPDFSFSGVPESAKSLAIIMHDPDAPVPGGWTHWTAWNIDPKTRTLTGDSLPSGAMEGTTSAKATGYRGPCPPSGTHHYHFYMYALDTLFDLPASTTVDILRTALTGHIVSQAELIGTYK